MPVAGASVMPTWTGNDAISDTPLASKARYWLRLKLSPLAQIWRTRLAATPDPLKTCLLKPQYCTPNTVVQERGLSCAVSEHQPL